MWNKFNDRFFENKKKYGIVIDFFTSTFHQNNLKEVLSELTYGNRYGDEYLGCCLSTLYDEDEKDEEGYFEDGVKFHECDEEEIIDYSMYVKCMELACEIYMEEHGEDEEVKRDLQIIRERYADK